MKTYWYIPLEDKEAEYFIQFGKLSPSTIIEEEIIVANNIEDIEQVVYLSSFRGNGFRITEEQYLSAIENDVDINSTAKWYRSGNTFSFVSDSYHSVYDSISRYKIHPEIRSSQWDGDTLYRSEFSI